MPPQSMIALLNGIRIIGKVFIRPFARRSVRFAAGTIISDSGQDCREANGDRHVVKGAVVPCMGLYVRQVMNERPS